MRRALFTATSSRRTFLCWGRRAARQIKILDFGLAKRQGAGDLQNSGEATAAFGGQATSAGTGMLAQNGPRNEDLTAPESTLGTVAYMSPEQARGTALDARTDLFSLGTVMYEMATGTTPFRGDSTADMFAALLTKEPPPVSRVNPAMPKKLDPIIQKLMAKDKTARYASAEELQKALDGLDTAGKASRTPLVAAGVVVVLLLAGLGWWKLKPAGRPRAAGRRRRRVERVRPQARREELKRLDYPGEFCEPDGRPGV